MKITSRREVEPPEKVLIEEEDDQPLPVPNEEETYQYYNEDWVLQGAQSFSIIPH